MLTILCYHGITKDKSYGIENYSHKHIPYNLFREQLEKLLNFCQVISMDDVIDIYRNKTKINDNLVAITFDDGFKNNYEVAAPILDKLNFKATFYITSGLINTNNLFWVDQLENSINSFTIEQFSLELGGKNHDFKTNTLENKIESLKAIKHFCKKTMNSEKNRIVDYINKLSLSSIVNTKKIPNYEIMNWSDIRKLNENKNFILGGHSLKHNLFSKIESKLELKKDIETSIDLIKNNIGENIHHYSYPEGQKIHFNKSIIKILKKNKIKCCPTAIDGINDGSEDLFSLKRIMPNFMGREFPKIQVKY